MNINITPVPNINIRRGITLGFMCSAITDDLYNNKTLNRKL